MSRIINPDSAGKERAHLAKAIVHTIRELAQETDFGAESRDMAAYITLALACITETIEVSVAAWEKRGYWVKADKFRMEWAWAGQLSKKMKLAILADDWVEVARIVSQTAGRLTKITVPVGNRLGRPWAGAWKELSK